MIHDIPIFLDNLPGLTMKPCLDYAGVYKTKSADRVFVMTGPNLKKYTSRLTPTNFFEGVNG